MALKSKLNLLDYIAIGVVTAAIVGSNYLISEANIRAESNRIIGEMKVADLKASTERRRISENFDDFITQMKVIVNEGLEAREDEVALAMTRLIGVSDRMVLRVSNMPIDGTFFRHFNSVSDNSGSARLVIIGDVGVGQVSYENLNQLWAANWQGVFDSASEVEIGKVQFQILLEPDQLSADHVLSARILRSNIDRLESALEKVE